MISNHRLSGNSKGDPPANTSENHQKRNPCRRHSANIAISDEYEIRDALPLPGQGHGHDVHSNTSIRHSHHSINSSKHYRPISTSSNKNKNKPYSRRMSASDRIKLRQQRLSLQQSQHGGDSDSNVAWENDGREEKMDESQSEHASTYRTGISRRVVGEKWPAPATSKPRQLVDLTDNCSNEHTDIDQEILPSSSFEKPNISCKVELKVQEKRSMAKAQSVIDCGSDNGKPPSCCEPEKILIGLSDNCNDIQNEDHQKIMPSLHHQSHPSSLDCGSSDKSPKSLLGSLKTQSIGTSNDEELRQMLLDTNINEGDWLCGRHHGERMEEPIMEADSAVAEPNQANNIQPRQEELLGTPIAEDEIIVAVQRMKSEQDQMHIHEQNFVPEPVGQRPLEQAGRSHSFSDYIKSLTNSDPYNDMIEDTSSHSSDGEWQEYFDSPCDHEPCDYPNQGWQELNPMNLYQHDSHSYLSNGNDYNNNNESGNIVHDESAAGDDQCANNEVMSSVTISERLCPTGQNINDSQQIPPPMTFGDSKMIISQGNRDSILFERFKMNNNSDHQKKPSRRASMPNMSEHENTNTDTRQAIHYHANKVNSIQNIEDELVDYDAPMAKGSTHSTTPRQRRRASTGDSPYSDDDGDGGGMNESTTVMDDYIALKLAMAELQGKLQVAQGQVLRYMESGEVGPHTSLHSAAKSMEDEHRAMAMRQLQIENDSLHKRNAELEEENFMFQQIFEKLEHLGRLEGIFAPGFTAPWKERTVLDTQSSQMKKTQSAKESAAAPTGKPPAATATKRNKQKQRSSWWRNHRSPEEQQFTKRDQNVSSRRATTDSNKTIVTTSPISSSGSDNNDQVAILIQELPLNESSNATNTAPSIKRSSSCNPSLVKRKQSRARSLTLERERSNKPQHNQKKPHQPRKWESWIGKKDRENHNHHRPKQQSSQQKERLPSVASAIRNIPRKKGFLW
eukprot:CAMPEP_0183712504 /NCGR_PEP_ID=MMETSP0737-20130205/7607_1 /TAXON_ID=385413 /ORGANISM="Thalassiosira miniscula, Strain CCMP1093" /LENGTH=959 /DNA_ID=CAMNT_0025941125 /DNA_START=234 /DNA_END=3113 /DNA_ORIENTATION=+